MCAAMIVPSSGTCGGVECLMNCSGTCGFLAGLSLERHVLNSNEIRTVCSKSVLVGEYSERSRKPQSSPTGAMPHPASSSVPQKIVCSRLLWRPWVRLPPRVLRGPSWRVFAAGVPKGWGSSMTRFLQRIPRPQPRLTRWLLQRIPRPQPRLKRPGENSRSPQLLSAGDTRG